MDKNIIKMTMVNNSRGEMVHVERKRYGVYSWSQYGMDEDGCATCPIYSSTSRNDEETEDYFQFFIGRGFEVAGNTVEKDEEPEKTEEPKLKIVEERMWDAYSVRDVCIKNGLYTKGDVRAYDKMLQITEHYKPTDTMIYEVAKDIFEHSDGQTLENVMFLIGNEAVRRFYSVKGGEQS